MERKIYLNKVSLSEAKENYLQLFEDYCPQSEEISTARAEGRVTAGPVYAERSAPDYYASAMDGIAVKAAQTSGASERNPVYLEKDRQALPLDTGDPVPEGFNAVIKIEDVNLLEDNTYEVIKGVTPWHNIRNIGESVVRGQMILPAGHKIKPYDIGALLEAGKTAVEVLRKPRVGLVPTGSELVAPEKAPQPGEITEFNSSMLAASARKWGAEVKSSGIVIDNREEIRKKVLELNKQNDITVIIAGSSAGEEDYSLNIIQDLGEVIVHGINIMPGKPVILGKIEDKPVIGLPGYPLSALLNFHLFVRELIYLMQKQDPPEFPQVKAGVKRKIPSKIGLTEFLRVNLVNQDEEDWTVVPRGRGSAAMKSIVRADGVMKIGEDTEGLSPEDKAPVILLKDKKRISSSLMMIGSHDLSLDLLASKLNENQAGFELNHQAVGSLAGLTALKRGECYLAGAHLLDEESGEYNISQVKRFFPDKKMALLNLVYRQQGLYVKKGNPHNLTSIKDIAGQDINFINRQRGSGTRVLLDFLLSSEGINPDQINGYDRERYTHIDAAVAVARGSADVALGIEAAAVAVGVDFVPIREEKYDLILPAELLSDWRIKYIQEILQTDDFRQEMKEMGGYRPDKAGTSLLVGEDLS